MVPRSDWSTASEISDLIVDFDPHTHTRRDVRIDEVEAVLRQTGDVWGIRQVRKMPHNDGVLDPDSVDRLLVRVHSELSRLGQELAQPARLRSLLAPMVEALREGGHRCPIRVVDLGCGVGYTVRWLTRHGSLGDDVELVGCDYNSALIDEARRLADVDNVTCTFQVANAFTLDQPATIVTSAGVLHHFRDDDLVQFFRSHNPATVQAFVHYDTTPTQPTIRYLGAWVFHIARMRMALSRHDGVISAMRTHLDDQLASAALSGAPWADTFIFEPVGTRSILINVMRPVIGMSPSMTAPFAAQLGRRAKWLISSAELCK